MGGSHSTKLLLIKIYTSTDDIIDARARVRPFSCMPLSDRNILCVRAHSIHVNPPSLVRSLRHFGIAENLRPRDENLRHLTVTSTFKKIAYLLAIDSENLT